MTLQSAGFGIARATYFLYIVIKFVLNFSLVLPKFLFKMFGGEMKNIYLCSVLND